MESPSSRERETGSPSKAKWELGWQAPDDILKIAVFDQKDHINKKKGATDLLRQKILRIEESMSLPSPTGILRRHRSRTSASTRRSTPGKFIESFRSLVRSVMLLLRCFKMRKKFAVQSDDLSITHQNRMVDLSTPERTSLSWELRDVLSTPPRLRSAEDIKKVSSYMRANGAIRAMLGQTSAADDLNLARYVSYDRYENGRVIAQQGRKPDRFYYIMSGKILVINEYYVKNSVISKTVSVLTKGNTTNVDELEKESERKQSLVCRGNVECIVLNRDDYFVLRRQKSGGAKEYLSTHAFFRLFPSHLLHNEGNFLHLQYYPNGTVVFPGGQQYEWIYIIKSGECALVRTQLVSNVICQKRTLFNKLTPEEIGCDRVSRIRTAFQPKADFRMWRRKADQPLWQRKTYTSPETKLRSTVDTSVQENHLNAFSSSTPHPVESTTLPAISSNSQIAKEETPNLRYFGVSPIDAAMAGISRTPGTSGYQQLLSRSRMATSVPQTSMDKRNISRRIGIKSAPPSLRRAHLELGRLKSGDVFGLDDLYGCADDVTGIALLSKGADVVRMKRRFFLCHAPADLQIKLSGLYHDYPTTGEARAALEATETWSMYKSALLKLITSGRKTASENTLPQHRTYSNNNLSHINSRRQLRRPTTTQYHHLRKTTSNRISTNANMSRGSKEPTRITVSAPASRPSNFQRNLNTGPYMLAFKA